MLNFGRSLVEYVLIFAGLAEDYAIRQGKKERGCSPVKQGPSCFCCYEQVR